MLDLELISRNHLSARCPLKSFALPWCDWCSALLEGIQWFQCGTLAAPNPEPDLDNAFWARSRGVHRRVSHLLILKKELRETLCTPMEESAVPKKVIFYHGAFVQYITPSEATAQPQDQSRSSASLKKLAGFSNTHLVELSADMYDELKRRTSPDQRATGHLEPRNDIHWKRNDVRKHVASLAESRFREICRDLVTEHERRYSELYTGPTYPLQDSMPMSDLISRRSQRTFDDESSENTVNFPSQSSSNSLNSRLKVKTDDVVIQIVNESNITPTKVHVIESDSENSGEEDEHKHASDSELSNSGISFHEAQKSDVSSHHGFLTEETLPSSGSEAPLTPVKDDGYHLSTPSSEKARQILPPSKDFYDYTHTSAAEVMPETPAETPMEAPEMLADIHSEIICEASKETFKNTLGEFKKDNDFNAQMMSALERDLDEMRLNLRIQQEVTEQVRREAAQFLQEMRALTRRHEEQISKSIALDSEVGLWQARHAKLSKELDQARSSRIETAINLPDLADPLPDIYISPSGELTETQLRSCISSITVLAAAVHGHERSQTLLDLLHRVVLSAREISSSDKLVVRSVNHLIAAVRNYAVSLGLYPRILVDAACSDLSNAVVEYAKVVKVIEAQTHFLETDVVQNNWDLNIATPTRDNSHSVLPASSSSTPVTLDNSFPEDINPITESTPEPNKTPVIPAEAPVTELRPAFEEPVAEPTKHPAEHIESHEKEIFEPLASPGRLHRLKQVPELPLDESILTLRSYLEDQTNGTVEIIGAILASIKSNETAGMLMPLISRINDLVGDMIATTEKTMNKTRSDVLKQRGAFIVQNLKDCLARMVMLRDEELEAIRDDAKPNRYLKQRLAGVNFDMAKSTKELVKTVEECVLQGELDHIDQRLE